MPPYKRTIRRGQTITPYGPGSILDMRGESFIIASANHWQGQGEKIREVRLQKLLGKQHFMLAPRAPDDNQPHPNTGLPVFRFPDWLFCGSCRTMVRWSRIPHEKLDRPLCSRCRRPLTPMRFIVVCPHGHIDDVPWDRWCHRGDPCENPQLSFRTRDKRTGLEDLYIQCNCSPKMWRSLEGITKEDAMQGIGARCTGRQPWERTPETCDLYPLVKQRGATNIYFTQAISSIDIPPYADASFQLETVNLITNTAEYAVYRGSLDELLLPGLAKVAATKLSLEVADVQRIMKEQASGETVVAFAVPDYTDEEELRQEEYQVFLQPRPNANSLDNFQKKDASLSEAYAPGNTNSGWNSIVDAVSSLVDRLVLITRLREVRAIRSFSRLTEPPELVQVKNVAGNLIKEPARWVAVDRPSLDWLPALEVFGEGIFMTLNTQEIEQWRSRCATVRQREELLRDRQADTIGRLRGSEASAPLILLHTLAHLLIRQLSFDCGYGSSSLRERLYTGRDQTGQPMAGLLIYTSAGDSEGTLGGLVRQGQPKAFVSTLVRALQQAQWCSSDPLCQESEGQGPGAMNLAACHACCLLPETSCEEFNRLLDRAMVVGTALAPEIGYFRSVLEAAAL